MRGAPRARAIRRASDRVHVAEVGADGVGGHGLGEEEALAAVAPERPQLGELLDPEAAERAAGLALAGGDGGGDHDD